MPSEKIYADKVEVDLALVARLLAEQFPHWADLTLRPIASTGADNTLFGLGDDLVARFPRGEWSAARVAKELRWLPWLAPQLPVAIPVPLGAGQPAAGYPWPWSIYRWLPGEPATPDRIVDPHRLAEDLAAFVAALRRIDPTDGPPAGQALALRDSQVCATITSLDGEIDAAAALEAWAAALRQPAWTGPPVWLHGDLAPGNILVIDGQLRAVIDFAGMGVGDPADDLRLAWTVLPPDARETFRATLRVDDATWARGRGYALAQSLALLRHYREAHPLLAASVRGVIAAILRDHREGR